MRRGLYSIVAGALLIGAAGHSQAQETIQNPPDNAGFATVIGLSRGDLLNIRAAASATGMVIARVPNGTLLKVAGCGAASGNLWCKVEDANDPVATGWTPARYLSGYEDRAVEVAASGGAGSDDELSIMSTEATFSVDVAREAKTDPRARGAVAAFYAEPLPAPAALDAQGETRGLIGGRPLAPLIALPVVPGEGTDLAPGGQVPAESGPPQLVAAPQPAPAAGESAEGAGEASRPAVAEEAPSQATGERVARLPAAAASQSLAAGAVEIAGGVPCARYSGQPMTTCRAAVVREGAGNAVITVNWPDGGQRVIRFRDGRMEGSDAAQEFRAERDADLNMIRIGKTERFEITDALIFGH